MKMTKCIPPEPEPDKIVAFRKGIVVLKDIWKQVNEFEKGIEELNKHLLQVKITFGDFVLDVLCAYIKPRPKWMPRWLYRFLIDSFIGFKIKEEK